MCLCCLSGRHKNDLQNSNTVHTAAWVQAPELLVISVLPKSKTSDLFWPSPLEAQVSGLFTKRLMECYLQNDMPGCPNQLPATVAFVCGIVLHQLCNSNHSLTCVRTRHDDTSDFGMNLVTAFIFVFRICHNHPSCLVVVLHPHNASNFQSFAVGHQFFCLYQIEQVI